VAVEPGRKIVAVKNVTNNEPFFRGHFPGAPVMPGVLIVEAMAQAAGVLALHGRSLGSNEFFLFAGIDSARFRSPVFPGDTLTLTLEVIRLKARAAHMKGVATVGERVAAEAEILSVLSKMQDPASGAEHWKSGEATAS
jgi:3-hydroxyacyl-[acyl-carrier-protein] dehydratase